MNPPRSQHSVLRSPYLWLTLACVGSLLPFIDKAFHIDDPLFLWTARQIQAHPVDFYGFNINWYWSEMPMSEVTKNPPLAAYYIALVTALFGWSEVVLHAAFMVWPVGVVLGTYQLAKAIGTRPVLAALATLWTPVFLVSSSNVMSDTCVPAASAAAPSRATAGSPSTYSSMAATTIARTVNSAISGLRNFANRLSHRNRGVATALMRTAEELAIDRGRTLLVLDTAVDDGASWLYERAGFTLTGIIPDYALKPHGGLTGTMIYWKRLAEAPSG